MSSHPPDAAAPARPATERLLMLLKMRGPLTAAELGQAIGTTGENARQHLARLKQDGLVETRAEPRGVGRPAQTWHLTDAARRHFPDTHAELTAGLLRLLHDMGGPDLLDRLIAAREAETGAAYRRELDGIHGLAARIAALAAIRSREGYMAEWHAEAGGHFLLIENHCPICAAATACAGFCRAERDIFQDVLGPTVVVERRDHIPSGARRCAYRIRPAGAPT